MMGLPAKYRQRDDPSYFIDAASNLVYQPHVYELAAFIASRAGIGAVIDVGCGSGQKLGAFSKGQRVIGVDFGPNEQIFRANNPGAAWVSCDLERSAPSFSDAQLADSLVICADVIEHLRSPAELVQFLVRASRVAPYVLISTPDRDRVRGWLDMGPPANPSHVREWSGPELLRYLVAEGLDPGTLHGHTINTLTHRVNSTILIVAGREATFRPPIARPRVAAIMHVFNEEDIVEESVRHLVSQGVEVHAFDNWSTDATWAVLERLRAERLVAYCARFPDRPTGEYRWREQLGHTSTYARSIDAEWVLHHDADEFRCSPWPGVSLRDGIAHAEAAGYNAIDFTVIDFRFTRDQKSIRSEFQDGLRHFEFGRRPGHFLQIKGWRNSSSVDLAASGGHDANFPGRRVFPMKFLLKHYPLRNADQARRKVFEDRLPRTSGERAAFGWHGHYSVFEAGSEVPPWDAHQLHTWSEQLFRTEFLVQRLGGIGVR